MRLRDDANLALGCFCELLTLSEKKYSEALNYKGEAEYLNITALCHEYRPDATYLSTQHLMIIRKSSGDKSMVIGACSKYELVIHTANLQVTWCFATRQNSSRQKSFSLGSYR